MTPTPTRPEPTTPIRKSTEPEFTAAISALSVIEKISMVAECKWAQLVLTAAECRALKQHLTSEPAGPTVLKEVYFAKGPITDEDKAEWERAAKHAQPIDLEVLDVKLREPEPAASVPVTREQLAHVLWQYRDSIVAGNSIVAVDAILALLAASTGARGAVVEEIAKRHEAAHKVKVAGNHWRLEVADDAHADRATLLALIGAKQP